MKSIALGTSNLPTYCVQIGAEPSSAVAGSLLWPLKVPTEEFSIRVNV